MIGSLGQVPDSVAVLLTKATFPAVAANAIVPLVSAAGRAAPLLPPEAS